MKRSLLLVLVMAMALFAACSDEQKIEEGLPDPSIAACKSNTDCLDGGICTDGKCVAALTAAPSAIDPVLPEPGKLGQPCKNGACDEGLTCVDDSCVVGTGVVQVDPIPCGGDHPLCSAGFFCSGGFCKISVCDPACSVNQDCVEDKCVTKAVEPVSTPKFEISYFDSVSNRMKPLDISNGSAPSKPMNTIYGFELVGYNAGKLDEFTWSATVDDATPPNPTYVCLTDKMPVVTHGQLSDKLCPDDVPRDPSALLLIDTSKIDNISKVTSIRVHVTVKLVKLGATMRAALATQDVIFVNK